MTPRVSVVIATRDRQPSLARALASVDAQRFRDYEVVVVDDASTDDTVNWLRTSRAGVHVVARGASGGAAAARNLGVTHSSGDIVAFLDDDDAWRPSYLEGQVAHFDAHEDLTLSSTGHVEVDRGGAVAQPDIRPVFNYTNPIVHLLAECPLHTLSVVACRRSAWQRVGPFDETLEIVHDLDWYARVIHGGGRWRHIPTVPVDRGVPGGLVSRHRHWYREERAVHRRLCATMPIARREMRRVRASRGLLFARVGLAKSDVSFAFARVVEAFWASPLDAARIATRRFQRWQRRDAAEAWSDHALEAKRRPTRHRYWNGHWH